MYIVCVRFQCRRPGGKAGVPRGPAPSDGGEGAGPPRGLPQTATGGVPARPPDSHGDAEASHIRLQARAPRPEPAVSRAPDGRCPGWQRLPPPEGRGARAAPSTFKRVVAGIVGVYLPPVVGEGLQPVLVLRRAVRLLVLKQNSGLKAREPLPLPARGEGGAALSAAILRPGQTGVPAVTVRKARSQPPASRDAWPERSPRGSLQVHQQSKGPQ